jgi:hypothetical protein
MGQASDAQVADVTRIMAVEGLAGKAMPTP